MITLISIGKLKHYTDMVDTYVKRIQKYTKLNIVELKAVRDNNKDIIKEKEGKHILEKLDKISRGYVVVLHANGKQFASEEFANILNREKNQGKDIVFVIGGAVGISDAVQKRANLMLSFSKMTVQHDLAKLVLIEQIYRAHTILHNEPYHK